MKTIVILLLVLISGPAFAADQLEHPNDFYLHGGIMTACSATFNAIFSSAAEEPDKGFAARHPKLMTALICSGVGLVKEFAWDDRADYRDILSNEAGVALGIGITVQW